MKIKLILLTIIIGFFFSGNALAKNIHLDGYDVEVKWEQIGKKKVKVWGSVSNGEACPSLNLTVTLENTKDPAAKCVIDKSLIDYDKTITEFKGKDKIKISKKHADNWFLKMVDVKCVK
ncbi:hypothetical protein [Desulfosediminicola flagellatus]|uniref:hypothetical protein n=1 Tax=Desulfosediminicola flagellatus TaxID=2569541 RepID=UPI0010AD1F35|nr:hypothetical protein [Desulfosediminicola flagellatus]